MAAGLRAVAAGFHKVEAPARLEGRLLAAFRTHSGIKPLCRDRRWIPAVTWATAVAAMFALAVFLMRDHQPEAARATVSRVERAMAEQPSGFEGFIPLPSAGAEPAGEDEDEAMDVVHVEVPRSAMLAVGLEVSPDRSGEMVQADVMLGSDGVARAVRFLN